MAIQKIFKAGNSKAVVIPSEYFYELDLKIGQSVIVDKIDEDSLIIKKTHSKDKKTTSSQKEFTKWLDSTLQEDAEILTELANR